MKSRRILLAMVSAVCLMFVPLVRAEDKPGKGEGKIRIACVGDSITYGAGVKDREKNCYPAQLQTMLGDKYEVKNFGVSGATLLKQGDKPYWKEKAFEQAKTFGPAIVVIKLGTNDSKPQNWKHKDEFTADYKAMIEEFQALPSKPKIFVCHPVPAFPGNFGIRDEVMKNEQLPMLDEIAKSTGATIIDLYAALDGKKELFPDKVHPNADGAKIIAQTVSKALAAVPVKAEK